MIDKKVNTILDYIGKNPLVSSKKIHEETSSDIGYATVKRLISNSH